MTQRHAVGITVASAAIALALAVGLMVVGLAAAPQQTASAEKQLEAAIHREQVLGDVKGAIEQYKQLAQSSTRAVAAQALVHLGQCYEKLGETQLKDARATYERVVRDFGDQPELVAEARKRLAALAGPASKPGGLQMRKIWAQDAPPVVERALTADGKYFRGIDEATGDVVQFEIATQHRTRIANKTPWTEKKRIVGQVFSRDGKQIVYNSYAYDLSTRAWTSSVVSTRSLDGSDLRTLHTEKNADVYPLDWSPDAGSIVALREEDATSELVVISTADGSVQARRSIPSGWISNERASYSPDGRFIAFGLLSSGSDHSGDIFLMTADGRNEVAVAGHPAYDDLIGWTPDGRSLIFLSDRSGTADIWSVPVTGGRQEGEPVLLKKDFGFHSIPVGIAPDGSLYYGTQTNSVGLDICEVDLETGKVLVPPAPVTTRYSETELPTWSPDGKSLLYISWSVSNMSRNPVVTIRSAATGEERFLSPRLQSFPTGIQWAPDSRSLIAQASTETETAIFRIDTETSGVTKLAPDGMCVRLCPDGKTLVFVKGGTLITKRNLDTGEESPVAKAGSQLYDLSPDGTEVVFQVNGVVNIVSLNGGEPRELLRGLAQVYRLRWTRDGRYIIAQAVVPASLALWRVPAQGGKPLKLDLSVPRMGNDFSLNPDNRRLAFNVNGPFKIELWVLENFLTPPKSPPPTAPVHPAPIPALARPANRGKVLMIVNEGKSSDLELMLTKEVGVMKSLLEKAGFEVMVSTASNQPLVAGGATLKPDLKFSDVHVADYKGVVMPCMAVNSKPLPPEGVAIIKEAVAKGKPLAAQTGSVILLARAGVLAGRKYAGRPSWRANYPEVKDAVYSGDGVVQDGKIITSGTCPYTAKQQGLEDGTSRLTEALIAELKR